MSNIAKTISELKEKSESQTKKKYLTLPSAKAYNSILDTMENDPEMEKILEDYFAGSEKNKAKNESIMMIIDGINMAMEKTKDKNKLEVLQAQKEKMEKQITGGSKITMKLVLKYLLATNKNPSIQEIADRVSA